MKIKSVVCDIIIVIMLTVLIEFYFLLRYAPFDRYDNTTYHIFHLTVLIIYFVIGYIYSKLCGKFNKVSFVFDILNFKQVLLITLIIGFVFMVILHILIMSRFDSYNMIINIYAAILPSINYLSIFIGRKLGLST